MGTATAIKLEDDPAARADEIMKRIGDLGGFHVPFNRILVAQYIRPEKTSGGVYLSIKSQKEDVYQGKAGLVLKLGTNAYVDDSVNKFAAADKVAPGDWVMLRTSDGLACKVNGVDCRLIEEINIQMRIPSPEAVY